MSPLPLLLIFLTSQCCCADEDYFSVTWDQHLGVKQCQKKCSERRGCTDVEYSSDSLNCTLRFNISQINDLQVLPACERYYCTEYMVMTRSGKRHVLETFLDAARPAVSPPRSFATLLTFKPSNERKKCKQSGKHGQVIESADHYDCMMRGVNTFRAPGTYSWFLTLKQKRTRRDET